MTDQALATDVPLGPDLTEQEAWEISGQGEQAVDFTLLILAQMRADGSTKTVVRSAWCICSAS